MQLTSEFGGSLVADRHGLGGESSAVVCGGESHLRRHVSWCSEGLGERSAPPIALPPVAGQSNNTFNTPLGFFLSTAIGRVDGWKCLGCGCFAKAQAAWMGSDKMT